MNRKKYWEKVYRRSAPDELGWYQSVPQRSLDWIASSGVGLDGNLIDVGGGASNLVDHLLELGHTRISVLDLSEEALTHAQRRLGSRADRVNWLVQDVTEFQTEEPYDLWHDRAVLHFLTREKDRELYAQAMARSIRGGGQAVIATFSLDGPRKCTGRRVRRHGQDSIVELFDDSFDLLETQPEMHRTPQGTDQRFSYFRLRRKVD